MKMMMKNAVILAASSVIFTACSRNNKETVKSQDTLSNAVVLEWNEIAFQAFDGPLYQHSLMASRINVMTQLAIHDAINAVTPHYASYTFTGRDSSADPIAAAASAAYTVLVQELPAKKNFLDSCLAVSLGKVNAGDGKQKGIALGQLAGQAILANRANDGSAGDVAGIIPPSTTPGVYQTVPPFDIVFAPHWQNMKTFGLQSKDQFRSIAPPALASAAYTTGFNEVKETGKLTSATRSPDQTAYAKFWYEFSEAGWNRVARSAIAGKNLGLYATARLFALVDMAMADAYVAGWDSKFFHNFWRPYTAIRAAANDGNPSTTEDIAWEPSEVTPPVHDYPSTHSALGNAAATVLAKILGNNTGFSMTSFTAMPLGTTRSFSSFTQAADENADSRVRAGIHFRFSCDAGQLMGDKIGEWIVNQHLKPLK